MKRRDLMMSVAAISFSAALPAFAEDQHQSPIGFILVGASWCPFCKSASGTLFAAAVPAELPVLVASQDGHPIPPFPRFCRCPRSSGRADSDADSDTAFRSPAIRLGDRKARRLQKPSHIPQQDPCYAAASA